MRVLLGLAAICLFGGCDQLSPPPPMHLVTLPSGKQIKAFDPGIATFSGDIHAYQFSYLTSIPLSLPTTPPQQAAITAEISEIWEVVRPDAEKSGVNIALINARSSLGSSIPIGANTITSSHGYGLAYKRGADGNWVQVPPGVNFLAK